MVWVFSGFEFEFEFEFEIEIEIEIETGKVLLNAIRSVEKEKPSIVEIVDQLNSQILHLDF